MSLSKTHTGGQGSTTITEKRVNGGTQSKGEATDYYGTPTNPLSSAYGGGQDASTYCGTDTGGGVGAYGSSQSTNFQGNSSYTSASGGITSAGVSSGKPTAAMGVGSNSSYYNPVPVPQASPYYPGGKPTSTTTAVTTSGSHTAHGGESASYYQSNTNHSASHHATSSSSTSHHASGVSGLMGASAAGGILHIPHLHTTHGHSGSPPPLRQSFRKIWENIKAEERETVGNFELYSEIMGVCRGCFTPGTTYADAPRTHHYGQRWHPEKGWRVKRKRNSRRVLFGWFAGSRRSDSSASSSSPSSSSSSSSSSDSGSDLSDNARKRKMLQRNIRREQRALKRQDKRESKYSFYSSHRRRDSSNSILSNPGRVAKSMWRTVTGSTAGSVSGESDSRHRRGERHTATRTRKHSGGMLRGGDLAKTKDSSLYYNPGYDSDGHAHPYHYTAGASGASGRKQHSDTSASFYTGLLGISDHKGKGKGNHSESYHHSGSSSKTSLPGLIQFPSETSSGGEESGLQYGVLYSSSPSSYESSKNTGMLSYFFGLKKGSKGRKHSRRSKYSSSTTHSSSHRHGRHAVGGGSDSYAMRNGRKARATGSSSPSSSPSSSSSSSSASSSSSSSDNESNYSGLIYGSQHKKSKRSTDSFSVTSGKSYAGSIAESFRSTGSRISSVFGIGKRRKSWIDYGTPQSGHHHQSPSKHSSGSAAIGISGRDSGGSRKWAKGSSSGHIVGSAMGVAGAWASRGGRSTSKKHSASHYGYSSSTSWTAGGARHGGFFSGDTRASRPGSVSSRISSSSGSSWYEGKAGGKEKQREPYIFQAEVTRVTPAAVQSDEIQTGLFGFGGSGGKTREGVLVSKTTTESKVYTGSERGRKGAFMGRDPSPKRSASATATTAVREGRSPGRSEAVSGRNRASSADSWESTDSRHSKHKSHRHRKTATTTEVTSGSGGGFLSIFGGGSSRRTERSRSRSRDSGMRKKVGGGSSKSDFFVTRDGKIISENAKTGVTTTILDASGSSKDASKAAKADLRFEATNYIPGDASYTIEQQQKFHEADSYYRELWRQQQSKPFLGQPPLPRAAGAVVVERDIIKGEHGESLVRPIPVPIQPAPVNASTSANSTFVHHHTNHSNSVTFNKLESGSASTARQVSAGVESQSHSEIAGLAGAVVAGIVGGLSEREKAHKTEEEERRIWRQEEHRGAVEVGHTFGKEGPEEQRKGEENRAFEVSRIQKEQHDRMMYDERVRRETAEQEAREMGQLIYERQEAERLRKSQEERRIQLDLELQEKRRDEEALELQRIQLTLARERENETIRRIEQARQEGIARKERLAKEERSRKEEQEQAAEYRRRMEMERDEARAFKLEEEQKAVMALQLKRVEDERRIQREREREVRAAEEKRRMAALFEMERLEEVEFERRMFMQRERSKQLREQALQRAQYEFQRARQTEEEEKRGIQIQIEAEKDLRRKRLVEEDEKRLAEHREKKGMEEEIARQLHAQAEAEKLRVKLQKQQEEERRLDMEEEMTRTLQAQIEAEKVKEDQQKREEGEKREHGLQAEEYRRTIATVEAKRRDAVEFQMIEREIQLERERKAEEEHLIQMEVDRRLAAERAEQERIDLEAKAAELKAQMAVLAAQQKEAREARRRKRKADPNYREREVSRNRERSRERETEREKARREQVEMIRKNAGLDEKPSKSKRSVSFAELPTRPVEFTERSWTFPGGVPKLVQTAPTPPPGTPKTPLLVHVDPSSYFPPTEKEKEGESSNKQSGAQELEEQRLEIGSPEVIVASPPLGSPEVGFSTLDKEIAVGTPFTGIPVAPQPYNAIGTAETVIAIGTTEESQETTEEQRGRQRNVYYGPALPEGYQFRSALQESFYGPGLPIDYFSAGPGPSVPIAEPVYFGQSPPMAYGPPLPDNYKYPKRPDSESSEEGRFHSPAEFTETELKDCSKPPLVYDEAVSGASSMYVVNTAEISFDNTAEVSRDGSWENLAFDAALGSGKGKQAMVEEVAGGVGSRGWKDHTGVYGRSASSSIDISKSGEVTSTNDTIYGPELSEGPAFERSKSEPAISAHEESKTEVLGENASYYGSTPEQFLQKVEEAACLEAVEAQQQYIVYGPPLPQDYLFGGNKSAFSIDDRSSFRSADSMTSQATVAQAAKDGYESLRSYVEQSKFEGSSESYTLSGLRSEQVAPEVVAYGPPLPHDFVFEIGFEGKSSGQRAEEPPSSLHVSGSHSYSESHAESRSESQSITLVSQDAPYYGPPLPEGFEFKKARSSKRRSRQTDDERPVSHSFESRSESRVTTADAQDMVFGPPLPEVKKRSGRSEKRSSRDVSASSSTDSVVYGPALSEDMQLQGSAFERRSRTTFGANVPSPTEGQATAPEGHRLRRSQTERVKPQHGADGRPRSYVSDARSSAETLDHRQGALGPEGRRLRRSNTERVESRRSHEGRSGVLSEFGSRPGATAPDVSGATDVQYQHQPIPAMPEERRLKHSGYREVLDERSIFYSSEPTSSGSTTTFIGSAESQAHVQIGRGMPPMPEGHRLKRTQTERVDTRHALADERPTSYSSESRSGAAAGSFDHQVQLPNIPGVSPMPEGPRLKRSQTERVDARHSVIDARSAVVEERATTYSSESRSSGVTASVSGFSEHHQIQPTIVAGIPQMSEGQRLKRSQTERADPQPVIEDSGTSPSSELRVESQSGASSSERWRAFPEGHRLKRSTTERARPTKTRPTADERAPFYSSEARARSDEFIAKIDRAQNMPEGLPLQRNTSSSSINSQVYGYDSSRNKSGYSADVTSASESEFATPPTGGTMDNTPTATTRNTPVSRQHAQGSREGSRSVTPTPPSRRSTEEKKQENAQFTAIAVAAAEAAGFNSGLVLGQAITATPEATKPPTPVDPRSVEEEETKHNRSRSMSRISEVLRSGSQSKSRRQRAGSLFGRSKASDSMSSDSRADSMTAGSGGVSLESSPPTLERSTDTARRMSLTANVLASMKRLGGGGDKSHPQGAPGEVERRVSLDQSPNTPHTTPPASIMDGWMSGRRSRKSSVTYHSDDSQMLEETERLAAGSGTESKKEKKERIEREKKEKKEEKAKEKKEKKEEKEKSSGEAGSPESGKSRWGGLFGKLGGKQMTPSSSPSKHSFASVAQKVMADPALTKIPPPPTRSGSDEGETHTRPTTSRSFRSFAGVFGGGRSDHATDSANPESASIHNEDLTSQDLGRPSFDASQSEHAEARMMTFQGPQEEVSGDDVRDREAGKGTVEISDQAGIQGGERNKRGIPVPRGGLRRGRSTEFAELVGRGSLDERGLPSPIPELSEGRNSWRNSREIGMSLDQVAGINRADTCTPEQIPPPTPDVVNEDQEFRGPETRIPQLSKTSSWKALARKKKTGDLAAASSESIDSLPEQHQSGDVNDTEVRMESCLPQIRRTEGLKDDGGEALKHPAEPPDIYDDRDNPSPIQSPYVYPSPDGNIYETYPALPNSNPDSPYLLPTVPEGLPLNDYFSPKHIPLPLSGPNTPFALGPVQDVSHLSSLPSAEDYSPFMNFHTMSDLPALPASGPSSRSLSPFALPAFPAGESSSPFQLPTILQDIPVLSNSAPLSPVIQPEQFIRAAPVVEDLDSFLSGPEPPIERKFPEYANPEELPELPESDPASPVAMQPIPDDLPELPRSDPSSPVAMFALPDDLPELPPSAPLSPVVEEQEGENWSPLADPPRGDPASPIALQPLPDLLPRLPRNDPTSPIAMYPLSDSLPELPRSHPSSPIALQSVPGNLPQLPRSDPSSPIAMFALPDNLPELPRSDPSSPIAMYALPDNLPELPQSDPASPIVMHALPGNLPVLPRSDLASPIAMQPPSDNLPQLPSSDPASPIAIFSLLDNLPTLPESDRSSPIIVPEQSHEDRFVSPVVENLEAFLAKTEGEEHGPSWSLSDLPELPKSDPASPIAMHALPDDLPELPRSDPASPLAIYALPDNLPELPRSDPASPVAMYALPDDLPEPPRSDPAFPVAMFSSPKNLPALPESNPLSPVIQPEQPKAQDASSVVEGLETFPVQNEPENEHPAWADVKDLPELPPSDPGSPYQLPADRDVSQILEQLPTLPTRGPDSPHQLPGRGEHAVAPEGGIQLTVETEQTLGGVVALEDQLPVPEGPTTSPTPPTYAPQPRPYAAPTTLPSTLGVQSRSSMDMLGAAAEIGRSPSPYHLNRGLPEPEVIDLPAFFPRSRSSSFAAPAAQKENVPHKIGKREMELAREATEPPTPSTPPTPATPGKNKKKNKKKKKTQKQSHEETTEGPAQEEPLPPVREDVATDIGGANLERSMTEQSIQSVTTLGDEEGTLVRKGSKNRGKKFRRSSSVSSLNALSGLQFPGVPESFVEHTTLESPAQQTLVENELEVKERVSLGESPTMHRDHKPANLNLGLAGRLSVESGLGELATPSTPARKNKKAKKPKGESKLESSSMTVDKSLEQIPETTYDSARLADAGRTGETRVAVQPGSKLFGDHTAPASDATPLASEARPHPDPPYPATKHDLSTLGAKETRGAQTTTDTMGEHEHEEPIRAEAEVQELPTPGTGEKKKKRSKKKKLNEETAGSEGSSVATVSRGVEGSTTVIGKEHAVVDSRQLPIEPLESETRATEEGLENLSKSVEGRVLTLAASRPISDSIGSSDTPMEIALPVLPALSPSRPSSPQVSGSDNVSFSPPNVRRQSAPMEGKKIPGLSDILVGRPGLPSRWPSTQTDAATPSTMSDTGGVQLGSVPQTPSVLAEVRNLRNFGSSRTQEASGEPGDEDIIDGELTRSQTWPPVDPGVGANPEIDIDNLAQSSGQQGPLRPDMAESSQERPGRGGKEGWASLYRIASQFKR